MSINHTLRTLRESLNLSIQDVATGANVSFRTVLRAEQGYSLNAASRRQLCEFYGKTSEELGLVSQRKREEIEHSAPRQKESSQAPIQVQEMLASIQNLEQEGIDMNRSRRFFLQLIGAAGATLLTSSTGVHEHPRQLTSVSDSTIENLSLMTQHYRALQRSGLPTEDGLRSHINLIQNVLESVVSEKYRRDLWRIQTQSQLLARHSITKRSELGRARTWNELAIASAQFSGDTLLLGAAFGHLGHLYLYWQQNPDLAYKFIEQAQGYTKRHQVAGWFAMVKASIAATRGDKDECETSIEKATEIAHSLPKTAEYSDLYYTDFNMVGVTAFSGNCFLKVGEPIKALQYLTHLNIDHVANNRQASALYDISTAYTKIRELEAAQAYAFRSIDKAITTDRLYIVPRFIPLAQKIQDKDPHEPHATAILEYAQAALHTNTKGGLN